MSPEQIETAALKLSLEQRAQLAHKLIESLDDLSEREHEGLWAEEAQRRNIEMDRDPSVCRPGGEVVRRLCEKYL